MNIRISFTVVPPYDGNWKRHKWSAGQKANGGMNCPLSGGYVLCSSPNVVGVPAWSWDYKSEGDFIPHDAHFFPCPVEKGPFDK